MPENKEIVYEDVYEQEDMPETSEETKQEMESGEREEDIYVEEGREKLIEDAEISAWEEGFMEGASGRGQLHCCAYCGKLLGQDPSTIYEREFDGKILFFCSAEHAQKYAEKWQRKKEKQAEPEK